MDVDGLWRLVCVLQLDFHQGLLLPQWPERVANGGGAHKNICLWYTADESKQSGRRPLSIMTATPTAISPQSVYLWVYSFEHGWYVHTGWQHNAVLAQQSSRTTLHFDFTLQDWLLTITPLPEGKLLRYLLSFDVLERIVGNPCNALFIK